MLLQEDYDRVLGGRVRTVLDINTVHLFFDDKFESSMNKNNPKEVIYKYNDVIQKKCNCVLSKSHPNRILLAGIGGGTVLTGFNPKTPTIIDCVDISPVVIDHFKKYFFPSIKKHTNPNIKIKIHCASLQDFIAKNKKKYDSIIIDCFKSGGFDKTLYGILNKLQSHITKSGNVLINIHSSRTGLYSKPYNELKQNISKSIWTTRGHLSNTSNASDFGNLIVELQLFRKKLNQKQ
jgi:spermidine synthase